MLIVAILIISSSLVSLYLQSSFKVGDDVSIINMISNNSNPKPTPFEFRELTIPFLRERSYNSNLGDLQLYNKNSAYTSYLTSYNSDGYKINGLLTVPNGEVPDGGWPAIIFVHGYIPPTEYRTVENYSSYVDKLANNSFVVFKIDLRGHDKSEGEATGAYYSSDYVIDTLNAYEALRTYDFVKDKKIGLWGHSMAGNIVLRSAVVNQNIPAIVIWAGAVYTYEDMQKYGISDNSYRPPSQNSEHIRNRKKLRLTYGDYSSESDFWKQVVPTNYLENVNSAIQLNHSIDDNVVDIEYSRELTRILLDSNIKSELIEYTSGGHNISGTAFDTAMNNTIKFFREYLR